MKISKIFHFLYFSVLAIPLVTIPIFAIYSQNHEINDNSITINESYWEVQNKYETNLVSNKATDLINNHIYKLVFTQELSDLLMDLDGIYVTYFSYEENNTMVELENDNGDLWLYYSELAGFTITVDGEDPVISLDGRSEVYLVCNYWEDIASQISGMGNIAINQSNYIPTETIYHENTPVVYDDTDIMSQFMYQEYNFMDKYLGIYKFEPFHSIYEWVQNTFFTGSAPIVFTIFYQWFAYWLLISFCWLIFDVLMYVPLLVHKWLDKATIE